MSQSLSRTYSEVDAILNTMATKYVQKVPIELRNLFKQEKDKEYTPNINQNIPLDAQAISKETIEILAVLHLHFWCESKEEKEQLINLFRQNEKEREAKNREKYRTILQINQNQQVRPNATLPDTQNHLMVKDKKESVLQKVIRKIKSLF